MAARFYPITRQEMADLLEPWDFRLVTLPGTVELVWAKRRDNGIEMRIYSGIDPSGSSRGVGEDAIRVEMWWKHPEGKMYRIGGSKRVHRVENWRENLKSRMSAWRGMLSDKRCPECGAPMVECVVKNGPNKGNKFLGCCTWKDTKCPGRRFLAGGIMPHSAPRVA